MITAVAIEDKLNNSNISLRFARSPYFAIIDTINKTCSIIENTYINSETDVGLKLIDYLKSEYNTEAIIAFELGVKVQEFALNNNIQLILLNKKNRTLAQILKLLQVKLN